MRSKFTFHLICAKCSGPIEATPKSDKHGQGTRHEASGVEVRDYLAIEPCPKCYREAVRPIRLIKEALNLDDEI